VDDLHAAQSVLAQRKYLDEHSYRLKRDGKWEEASRKLTRHVVDGRLGRWRQANRDTGSKTHHANGPHHG
jgi:hypothetical protein